MGAVLLLCCVLGLEEKGWENEGIRPRTHENSSAYKRHVAKEWVKNCILIHAIAFMQWRLLYSPSLKSSQDEIKEIIEDRIRFMTRKQYLYETRMEEYLKTDTALE